MTPFLGRKGDPAGTVVANTFVPSLETFGVPRLVGRDAPTSGFLKTSVAAMNSSIIHFNLKLKMESVSVSYRSKMAQELQLWKGP